MKMSNRAIMAMEDSYSDRLLDVYGRTKKTDFNNLPAELIREMKTIHEEISWAEEGSLITGEDAERLWTGVEEAAQEILDDWESEIDND